VVVAWAVDEVEVWTGEASVSGEVEDLGVVIDLMELHMSFQLINVV